MGPNVVTATMPVCRALRRLRVPGGYAGHTGRLCSSCAEGHTLQGKFCKPCKGTTSPAMKRTVGLVVVCGTIASSILLLMAWLARPYFYEAERSFAKAVTDRTVRAYRRVTSKYQTQLKPHEDRMAQRSFDRARSIRQNVEMQVRGGARRTTSAADRTGCFGCFVDRGWWRVRRFAVETWASKRWWRRRVRAEASTPSRSCSVVEPRRSGRTCRPKRVSSPRSSPRLGERERTESLCMCALCPARRPLSARRVSGEGVAGEAAGQDRRVAGPSAFVIRQNVSPVARPPLRDVLC